MSYVVVKKIGNNSYYYEQESYRENGKVKTRSTYLGPVKPKRRGLFSGLGGAVKNAAMIKHIWQIDPTPEQLAKMEKEFAERDHINGLLTGPTITLEQLQEVIEHQNPGQREDTPEEAARALAEVEAVPEFAPDAGCPEPLQEPRDASSDDASPTPSEQPAEASPSEAPSEPSTPSEQTPSDAPEAASPE